MMLPQRARGAESRAENKSSNGPRRAQSKEAIPSILRRMAAVSLPGICWYPNEKHGFFRESRWHREFYSSLTFFMNVGDGFFVFPPFPQEV